MHAKISGGEASYNLSFNDIINYVPGKGRGDAKKGMYQHRNGKVLVVFSVNPAFVDLETLPRGKRANGKKTTRTEKTRIGMAMIGTDGTMRPVTCDDNPDGDKNWREFTGSITLAGNPHVVDAPTAAEYLDDEDDE